MKITIKSNPKELKKIRLEIKLYCKANFTKIDTSKVIIAVDEALQNVIEKAGFEVGKVATLDEKILDPKTGLISLNKF